MSVGFLASIPAAVRSLNTCQDLEGSLKILRGDIDVDTLDRFTNRLKGLQCDPDPLFLRGLFS